MAASLMTTAALVVGGMVAATPAQAFSSSSKLTSGGVTYTVKADSCNLYWATCSWSTSAAVSVKKAFTHYSYVRANGVKATVTLSKTPSATITGNNTALITAQKGTNSTSYSMSGEVKPSTSAWGVGARSRITTTGIDLNSGWTL